MQQLVCGLIGPKCSSQARTTWNKLFVDENKNAFFDFYRTRNQQELELRLSEMFLLERRGYIVDSLFQESIIPLLDQLDESVQKGSVDTVLNERGVLTGYWLNNVAEKRCKLWFP